VEINLLITNLLITNLLITNLLITNLLITNLLITNLLIKNLMQQTSCNKPHATNLMTDLMQQNTHLSFHSLNYILHIR
jgi:hypothetical protein